MTHESQDTPASCIVSRSRSMTLLRGCLLDEQVTVQSGRRGFRSSNLRACTNPAVGSWKMTPEGHDTSFHLPFSREAPFGKQTIVLGASACRARWRAMTTQRVSLVQLWRLHISQNLTFLAINKCKTVTAKVQPAIMHSHSYWVSAICQPARAVGSWMMMTLESHVTPGEHHPLDLEDPDS